MNKKGFALTEVLVVVVFLVSIFTFIYISIVPLIGKYENTVSTEKDIDIIYKLYHIRKLIMSDENRASVTDGNVEEIKCSDLSNSEYCINLMDQLELRHAGVDNYVIIYANNLNVNNLNSIKIINDEIGNYAEKYKNEITERSLFLLDTSKHSIANLYYDDAI